MAKPHSIDFSWHRRAQDSIAQGSLTNSKRPECFVKGIYPTHLKRGHGAHVWDMHGNKYVDFICGLGSNLIGYANTEITDEIYKTSRDGLALSLGSDLEIFAAEKVKEIFPFMDLVKFLKTGTEACMAAVRIARAKTERPVILSEGYHGWSDGFVSLTPPAVGVGFNEFLPLKKDYSLSQNIAAVIVEPIMTDASETRIEWLKDLRQRCTKSGTLLIFDEIITGFRYLKHGVGIYHGIEPDIMCLGKAMGGGMPIACVAGKKEIMNCGEYFVSSTFAGERASLGASIKFMQLLQTKYKIDELWAAGDKFIQTFNTFHPQLKLEGYPTRAVFKGDEMV
jgi:glutamate-1-semialdehyde 2,1-aminomutase